MTRLRGPYPRQLWALLFLALALVVLIAEIEADRVWPVAALLMIAVLIAAVPSQIWSDLLARVEKANFGPVGFDLRQAARASAANVAGLDSTGELPSDQSIFELRIRLEYKLAYVAKHLLVAQGASPAYLNVGSLVHDGYLTETDGRTAIGILETRQEELDALADSARAEFLEDAGRFVASVRANIFWGQVKRRLEGKDEARAKGKPKPGSLLRGEASNSGRRNDFIAGPRNAPYRVATSFALKEESKILDQVIGRVGREGAAAVGGERQVVVIPDNSDSAEREAGADGPAVVRLAGLRAFLEGA